MSDKYTVNLRHEGNIVSEDAVYTVDPDFYSLLEVRACCKVHCPNLVWKQFPGQLKRQRICKIAGKIPGNMLNCPELRLQEVRKTEKIIWSR